MRQRLRVWRIIYALLHELTKHLLHEFERQLRRGAIAGWNSIDDHKEIVHVATVAATCNAEEQWRHRRNKDSVVCLLEVADTSISEKYYFCQTIVVFLNHDVKRHCYNCTTSDQALAKVQCSYSHLTKSTRICSTHYIWVPKRYNCYNYLSLKNY